MQALKQSPCHYPGHVSWKHDDDEDKKELRGGSGCMEENKQGEDEGLSKS